MSKSIFPFLVMLHLLAYSADAQIKIKNYNWTSSPELNSIPDSLKNEDAVMISYDHSISNAVPDQYTPRFQSVEWVYERIKFMTNVGVERYTKFFLSRNSSQSFEILDARTIKPGNKVVDLTDDDLKQLDYSYETKGTDETDEEVRFSMPGVEAGDEVEFCYKLISSTLNTGTDVFLFSNLPCLHSTFTYTADKNIRAEVKDLSSMPVPLVEQNADGRSYKWEMYSLPAIGSQENSIPSLTFPYVSIVIHMVQVLYGPNATHDENISPSTWEGVYEANNFLFKLIELNAKDDSTAFAKFIFDKVGMHTQDSDSIFRQFCTFHKFICDSVSMAGWNESLDNKPLLYYMQNHKIDRSHLLALYQKFFHTIGMKYYMGFGRNKYAGVLDTNVATPHHVTDFFFGVRDSTHNLRLFMVSTPWKKYFLDEIPTYLEGTNVMLASKPDGQKKDVEVFSIKIPSSTPFVNYHNEKMRIDISFSKEEDSYDLRDYYSGALSTEYRFELSELLRDKNYSEALMRYFPDSKSDSTIVMENSTTFPFPVTFNYFFKCPRLLTEIRDSIFTIPIKKLLHFSIIKSSDKPRTVDYYTEQKYHHRCDYQLQFDQPIELLNVDKFTQYKENMFGSFESRVQKINSMSLLIHLDYTVNSFRLPAEDYKDIKELQTAFENFLNSSVIVKKL